MVLQASTGHRATNGITSRGAHELARMIARGELSSAEVVEAHIEQIEQVNAALNAVVVKRYDAARAEARRADEQRAKGEPLGPLHGVPMTVKECLDISGTPSTFGLSARAAINATSDDVYVARMRKAGAIVLGKSNVAQLLLYLESDNPLYGRTNNPWDITRSAGGSSGGEAAIIAVGGSPLGLGTDLGGSTRVPATFCGIASLKPTAGRTPDNGRYSIPIGQRAIVSQVGVLARTVDDVALGTRVLTEAPVSQAAPPRTYSDAGSVDVAQLRIAMYTHDGTIKPAGAVARAVTEAARLLEQRGAHVTEWTPPDVGHAVDLFYGLLSADGGAGMARALRGSVRDARIKDILMAASGSPRKVAAIRWLVTRMGQHSLASLLRNYGHADTNHYWNLVEAQMAYQRQFLDALDTDRGGPFDVILCPGSALPAFVHGATKDLAIGGGYTALYNVLGYPAGVVPFTRVRADEEVGRLPSKDKAEQAAYRTEQGSAGLPVGVQVVARPWNEHVALAVMRAIEAAASQRPDYPRMASLPHSGD